MPRVLPHRAGARAGWCLILAALIAVTGCAGYRLGPTNGAAAGGRSISINFFQNQTPEPRLVEAVNGALRKRVQQDGALRLDTSGAGDYVVNGQITNFERSALSFNPGDIATAQDYSLQLTAHVTVTERGTGRAVLDRVFSGRTSIRAGQNLGNVERQVVPLAASDLAGRIVSALVDGSW